VDCIDFDFPLLRLVSQETKICRSPPVHDFTGDTQNKSRKTLKRPTVKRFTFFTKIYGKGSFYGYISTEGVFVTQMPGNAGISVWPSVWVTTNCVPLRTGRTGERIPVGAIFFAPFQTGPGASSLLYNGYLVFPGVKRPGRAADLLPHLAPRLKEE
jgi:hypothetical protein